MAEGVRYKCSDCDKAIEAWSDGNPYYYDKNDQKKYAYHPDHEGLSLCIGNDSPHLCLHCGKEFPVDSRAPVSACPKCNSVEMCATFELDGKACPFCKKGTFRPDPTFHVIS